MSFFRKKSIAGPPEFLIVGLGNPGAKYENTRHNIGFAFIDLLCLELGMKADRLKAKSLYADAELGGHRVLFVKPQTFMNLSGESVRDLANFYKIKPQKIVVVFDDTSLPLAKLRIRQKGSDGGHNGVKSIIYCLNSDDFPRIKIGIGQKPHPQMDLADFVLSGFSADEILQLKNSFIKAKEALLFMLDGDFDKANKAII